jgi:hypothetical protein
MLAGMAEMLSDTFGAALRSGMFMLGLVIGCLLGAAYAKMRRAWRDWRTVKHSVPGFRKTAFRTVPRVIRFGAIAGTVGIVAVAGFSAAAEEVPTQPASVPSAVPSSPAPSGRR